MRPDNLVGQPDQVAIVFAVVDLNGDLLPESNTVTGKLKLSLLQSHDKIETENVNQAELELVSEGWHTVPVQ